MATMPGARPSPRSHTSEPTTPLRAAVVVEDDPVGQRHRARRPGDHGQLRRRDHVEELQTAQQQADMPTGDHQRAGRAQDARRPRRGAVARARSGRSARPSRARRRAGRGWRGYQESIARTSRDPVREGRVGDVGAHGPALYGVHAVEGMLEPLRVDARQLVDGVPVGERRGGEVRVGVEDVGQPPVEVQVVGAAVQHLDELGVVALPVLPAGGDGGDAALDLQGADRRPGRGPEPLGPEQDRGHPACTRTVRPTSSSIPRSVS